MKFPWFGKGKGSKPAESSSSSGDFLLGLIALVVIVGALFSLGAKAEKKRKPWYHFFLGRD